MAILILKLKAKLFLNRKLATILLNKPTDDIILVALFRYRENSGECSVELRIGIRNIRLFGNAVIVL